MLRYSLQLFFIGIFALLLVGCQQVINPSDSWSISDNTQPQRPLQTQAEVTTWSWQHPQQTSHPILENLTLPDWFKIGLYGEVDNARSLELVETDTQTVLFVGNRTADSVYALVDDNNDYQVDRTFTLVSWWDSPNGVAYKDGALYVAEVDTIHRFPDILNNLEDPISTVVFDDLPDDSSHGRKYIAFWPEGDLYIPIGAPCNICDAWLPYAALHALDLESNELRLVAEWIRNTVGFDWHPETGELRFTDNGRDRMGDDLPVDELNTVTGQGEHFGYPFCHQGDVQDPTFDSLPCSSFTPPFAKLGPHVAALWMTFHTGQWIPEEYADKVFIAEHGSRNRSVATGYRISTVDLSTGEYKSFISGWLRDGRTLWRPVDVVTMRDGSFLISDDAAWLVYRVRYEWPDGQEADTQLIEDAGEVVVEQPIVEYSVEALIDHDFQGTDLTFEQVEARTSTYTRHRISYMSNGVKVSGIMNIPVGEWPFPVIILNHGYIDPAVYTVGRGLKREQDYLARNGYAVLHTDYRNHGLSDTDPTLEDSYLFRSYFYAIDSINAILAIEALNDPRFATDRVGMMGHSMGWGVTMHAMIARPDLIDAWVLYAPVHSNEYQNMRRRRYENLSEQERIDWSERIGNIDDPTTFSPYSAETYFDRIEGPIQIYHGTQDESCPYDRALHIRDRMEQADIDVSLITFTDEKHEFIPQWNTFMEGVGDFFATEL